MAMCAAAVLDPGVYFAINVPLATLGGDAVEPPPKRSAAGASPCSRGQMEALAASVGEATLLARTGGAPSLAVGMATLFSGAFGKHLLALWYHFAIMFEALFILTTVDTGTRVGRFMLQELLGHVWATAGPHLVVSQHRARSAAGGGGLGLLPGAGRARSAAAASTRSGRCSASATSCWPRWRSASAPR